jgi:hypothetical protein
MDNSSLADKYADWIIKNKDKKGSPEFNTVADAYKETLQLLKGGVSNEKTNLNPTVTGSTTDAINKKEIPQQESENVRPAPAKVSSFKVPRFFSEANAGEIENILVPKVKQVESGGKHIDPTTMQLVKSKKGAEGSTQVMPATGIDPGFGVTPLQNKSEEEFTRFSTDYLKAMLAQFDGDTEKALAAYNWGPVVLKSHISKHGIKWKDTLPKETKDYIQKVMN